jgi:tRNA nucleotidyltransferase (CCA-adding enzyme)
MFFHDIGKPKMFFTDENGVGHFYGHGKESSNMANEILRRMRFDNKTIEIVTLLVEIHDNTIAETKKSVRRSISKIGYENFKRLIAIKCADNLSQNREKVIETNQLGKLSNIVLIAKDVHECNDCVSIKQLKISGGDLKEIGIAPSPVYSEILNDLLQKVMRDELANDKDELIGYINTHYMFKIVAKINDSQKFVEQGKNFDIMEQRLVSKIQQEYKKQKMFGTYSFVFEYYELDFLIETDKVEVKIEL